MSMQLILEENSSTSATVDRMQLSAVNRFWHQLGNMTQEDFSQGSHLVFPIQHHDSLFTKTRVCRTLALTILAICSIYREAQIMQRKEYKNVDLPWFKCIPSMSAVRRLLYVGCSVCFFIFRMMIMVGLSQQLC